MRNIFAREKQPYPGLGSEPPPDDTVEELEKQYPHERVNDSTVVYQDDLPVVCPAHTTERKLMTKIDLRVLPFLCILYLLAFLDRVNISNAALFKLDQDLHIPKNSTKYNTALVIFFVPYVLFEIPSNILLKKFKPHVWLSFCMFMFGLMSVCQGLTRTYGGLLATRFFLGLFETGMFPGCFYLIGMWYKRSEAQKRYSFFFSSVTLAGAFGGLLAAAIGLMQGKEGYNGWRWIFILEGTLTCVVAIIFFFFLPDFPEDAKWLKEEERAYVKARLLADQGRSAADRPTTLRDIGRTFKDFKVFLGGFMYFGLIVPAYGYAYFAPLIIKSYGYSDIEAQLHSVPPWAAAFGFSMLIAYFSDKFRHRYLFTVIPICVSIAGFAILLGDYGHPKAEYGALFLVTSGTYAAMPVTICWFTQNLGGHHRRAIGTGWQIGFGNIGGIIAVYAFMSKDAPKYVTGYSISIAFACLSALSCMSYLISCIYQNRSRASTPVDIGLTEYEKTEMGDLNPEYRYQL